MTARIIDGAALSQRIREEVAERVSALAAKGTRPGLAMGFRRVQAGQMQQAVERLAGVL